MKYFLPVIAIVIFNSCSSDKVIYDDIVEIDMEGWTYEQEIPFEFTVTDTVPDYRILLFLDFSTDYRWQNIYTRVETVFPNEAIIEDIVSLELASKTGQWFGDCNSTRCRVNIPLKETLRFRETGIYRINFQQHMRADWVKGINAIGLKLVQPASE